MAKPAPRLVVVRSITDVTPNMRRIVFGGPAMADFPEGKEAGYVKFIFPDAERANPDRPVMRTYSIRSHDVEAGEISVDFVAHEDTGGVAVDWALAAKPGDEILMGGPGAVKMVDDAADWYLIAADMTGLPAASCNLERLPANAKGYAIFEVLSEADKQDVKVPEGVDVQWIVNPKPEENKSVLLEAIMSAPWLEGSPFVWTACEFDTMRALRTYYRNDRGVDRTQFYLSSYWRAGFTEDQHKVSKREDAEANKA